MLNFILMPMVTLSKAPRDIDESISSAHAAEKSKDQQCLVTITENISFLARQWIVLHGDGDESNSNFVQLFYLRATDQPQLTTWLERKTDKYTSPQIQNELLTIMATAVLRKIGETI